MIYLRLYKDDSHGTQKTVPPPPNAQQKYRRAQTHKGLLRLELQVNAHTKARFDDLVDAVAEELPHPWSLRQRRAQARAQVFDDLTQGITPEFVELKDRIDALKAEIKALSPSFFKSDVSAQAPLPEAIQALPDDPEQLKKLLAQTYHEAQRAKQAAHEYKRQAHQYQELYEVASHYNDELQKRLKKEEY